MSLGDQLPSVEANHHKLEDLGGDGRQHALVVVLTDADKDAGSWLATDRKRMHRVMLIFCKSLLPVMTSTLWGQERQANNWFLYPWDEKVNAFPYRDVLYSTE